MSVEPITLRGTELSGKAGTEVEAARPGKRGRRLRIFGRYVALSVLAFIVLFPIYITIVNSLLQPSQIAAKSPTFFPTSPQWHTYSDAWSSGHLGAYLRNSFIQTGLIVAGQLVTSILAGYAFAFLRFPFKRTLFVVFLATLMVPFEITIITNLQTVSNTLSVYDNLGNTLGTFAALAVPFLATGFGAFLLRQTFLQLPMDLQDAAKLDGYGHLRFLTRVAVPLARPTIAALAVFSFLSAWNQYLWPLLVTNDDRHRTVQIGLKALSGASIARLNLVSAGAVIASLPIFVLLLLFQRHLVRGLTSGAVKG